MVISGVLVCCAFIENFHACYSVLSLFSFNCILAFWFSDVSILCYMFFAIFYVLFSQKTTKRNFMVFIIIHLNVHLYGLFCLILFFLSWFHTWFLGYCEIFNTYTMLTIVMISSTAPMIKRMKHKDLINHSFECWLLWLLWLCII